MHPAEYCGKFGSSLANPCEFGCGEPIGESMYMGDPVVQHYGNHLDLVGGDGGPSLFYKGTLYRSGVEDHSSSSSGLAGNFDAGPDCVQVGDGCAAGDEN